MSKENVQRLLDGDVSLNRLEFISRDFEDMILSHMKEQKYKVLHKRSACVIFRNEELKRAFMLAYEVDTISLHRYG